MPLPDVTQLPQMVIGFLLVLFRVAGLMIFAPLFGSGRIPRRIKFFVALVMAMALMPTTSFVFTIPPDMWSLTIAIGGELCFGIAMGLITSLVFIAAQWAGEMVGQQVGFNISQVFDPQYGGGGSVIGDVYFMFTLMIFLSIGGHRVLVDGIHTSLTAVPPAAMIVNDDLLVLLTEFMLSSTVVAIKLASPVFVTMLIVDVAMGCLSKTMPQFNIMSAGLSVRSIVGMVVVVLGLGVTGHILEQQLYSSLNVASDVWAGELLR